MGDWKSWVDLAGDLPRNSVFNVEESGEFGGVFKWRGEPQALNGEDTGLDSDSPGVDRVVADDDEIGVQRFGRCGGLWRAWA